MTDEYGRTPLHDAALEGDLAAMDLQLASGADPDVADRDGMTPLHLAAQDFRLQAVLRLIAAGAALDSKNRFGGTPLWVAVMNSAGRTEIVKALLNAGADPDCENASGISPRGLVLDSPPDDLHALFETA